MRGQSQLFATPAVSTPLFEIEPRQITVNPVDVSVLVKYQREMSKAVWRPAPGRKLAFLVRHDDDLLGLLFLASPVINFGARDEALGFPADPSERGRHLRAYADLSVCVGAQPIAWHWNVGKLLALIATTLGDHWHARYGDDLAGILTTSIYGRSSQYNRIYRFLGLSKGYGHEHISDDEYDEMVAWLRRNNVAVPPRTLSNLRWKRIAAYQKASGEQVSIVHGNRRGIYFAEARDPGERAQVIQHWYDRWGRPRYQRTRLQTPPYTSGLGGEVEPTREAA